MIYLKLTVQMVSLGLLVVFPPSKVVYRLHRATWTLTELALTFPSPVVQSITLIPQNASVTAGRFRVWLFINEETPGERKSVLLWDRKTEGGFPEMKVLVSRLSSLWFLHSNSLQKQRVRDQIAPGKSLGHSDAA